MNTLENDIHDERLREYTHPVAWPVPASEGRYHLVVLGGGPAGLVAALGAAGLGARVALVERGLLGGDCLISGCVPSKALLRSGHAAQAARDASALGVAAAPTVDFVAVMARLRRIRAEIAPHDSAERLRREGIDVFFGDARFTARDRVGVDGLELTFHRALIATGAHPALPPIPGLAEVGAMTNETLFTLTALPPTLLVLGAGVIGCEMAQAFARLGSRVHLVDQAERVLPREDPDASALVAARLAADGVQLHLGASVLRAERRADQRVLVLGDGEVLAADALLVALGRRPNVDLDLHLAGVALGPAGVRVDDHLCTTNPAIYAAGDVNGLMQYTHAADHQARLVLRNALFPAGRARVSRMVVPRVTYTAPEVAAVGLSAAEAASRPDLQMFTVGIGDTDRGRTDGESAGFARAIVGRGGRLHGAVVVGEHAGELLAPLTLAITHGLTMGQLASTIHPYPTRSELVFKLASAWNKGRLTPTVSWALKTWLSWSRTLR